MICRFLIVYISDHGLKWRNNCQSHKVNVVTLCFVQKRCGTYWVLWHIIKTIFIAYQSHLIGNKQTNDSLNCWAFYESMTFEQIQIINLISRNTIEVDLLNVIQITSHTRIMFFALASRTWDRFRTKKNPFFGIYYIHPICVCARVPIEKGNIWDIRVY